MHGCPLLATQGREDVSLVAAEETAHTSHISSVGQHIELVEELCTRQPGPMRRVALHSAAYNQQEHEDEQVVAAHDHNNGVWG